MPVGATLDDLQLFLYLAEQKNLDPLLGQAYARRQWSQELGDYQLIIIESIHGLLKLADATGQLNGITTEFLEGEEYPQKATVTVHRKGCDHPFVATAHWDEYVGCKMANGRLVPTKMWQEKSHVMLQKCATALALRLAFPAALGGVYVAEELEHDRGEQSSGAATESDDFVVAEKTEPSKPEEPPFEANKQEVKQEDPKKDAVSSATMPKKNEAISKNRAMIQRIMTDMGIHETARKVLIADFFRGYLGVEGDLPPDPSVFVKPLELLDSMHTANPAAIQKEFKANSMEFGKKLKASVKE